MLGQLYNRRRIYLDYKPRHTTILRKASYVNHRLLHPRAMEGMPRNLTHDLSRAQMTIARPEEGGESPLESVYDRGTNACASTTEALLAPTGISQQKRYLDSEIAQLEI
jgi:hypothetical protein